MSGDQVIEDDSESEQWALTLVSAQERKNWTVDMALQFEERFYRLADVGSDGSRWFYRFSWWPDEQILRKVILQGTGVAANIGRPAAGKSSARWTTSTRPHSSFTRPMRHGR